MAYQFDFLPVVENTDLLLRGALFTLELTAIGAVLGVGLGIVGALVRAWNIRPFAGIFRGLRRVDPQHAIPGAVVFFIFFGLPSLGLQISEWQAAVLAMVINLGAYSTEIIRAGIQAIPRGQLEAAAALAMTRFEAFRHVVLLPALGKVWPALSSQIIIVMLGSAVCSQIATEELSFAANFIQSRNFRAFETYALTTLIYLCMALLIRQLLNWIGRRYIARSSSQ
ncbi:amino acid ABC transporter permease [Pseudomonas lini]